MKRTLSVLGSTGSIGRQTLEVAQACGLTVAALTANRNSLLLEEQARKFRPKLVAAVEESAAADLKVRLADTPIRVAAGPRGVLEAATLAEADTVVTAVMGVAGLEPTLAAIRKGKRIALANKETMVCAGKLVMDEADRYGAEIVPVDSEHSAIFQCLQGCRDRGEVRRLILTASGGPFFGWSREALAGVTTAQALKHPNWSMGRKITVDSASLVNKALEVMEARWLFDVELDSIQVVIHPQSIIHSMVEYVDGAVIAQLGMPDMKLPIQYALFYPERRPMAGERVDFFKLGQITFERPDTEVFTGLKLGMQAARTGGSMPTVFNAANEKAVAMFLNHSIGFLEIPELIEKCMNHHRVIENPNVNEILQAEAETYEYIEHIKEN